MLFRSCIFNVKRIESNRTEVLLRSDSQNIEKEGWTLDTEEFPEAFVQVEKMALDDKCSFIDVIDVVIRENSEAVTVRRQGRTRDI